MVMVRLTLQTAYEYFQIQIKKQNCHLAIHMFTSSLSCIFELLSSVAIIRSGMSVGDKFCTLKLIYSNTCLYRMYPEFQVSLGI